MPNGLCRPTINSLPSPPPPPPLTPLDLFSGEQVAFRLRGFREQDGRHGVRVGQKTEENRRMRDRD